MNKLYYVLCLLTLLFVSCESTEDSDPKGVTIPSEFSSIEMGADQTHQSITFLANADWVVSLSETSKAIPSWVKVSPMSGSAGSVTLSLTLNKNESSNDRSANITITSGGVEESINITQEAFKTTLSLDKTSKEVDCTAGSFDVKLSSNISWKASDIPSWITLSSTDGDGDKTITFNYEANSGVEKRSATIKFKGNDYDSQAQIVVNQAAFKPTISLDATSKEVDCTSGSFKVNLSSNIDWQASNIPSWITINPTSGDGDKAITFNYEANTDTNKRSATIKFEGKDYDSQAQIVVNQAAFEPKLSLNTTNKEVACTSGSFEVNLSSNINWQASNIPSWITINPTSGDGDKTITFNYKANTDTNRRSATIKFEGEEYDNQAQIVVNQAAFEPTLSLGTTSKSVTCESGSFTIKLSSNINWQASDIPSWITINPTSGNGDKTITFSYKANTDTNKRSATIKFKGKDYDSQAQIVVNQAAFEPTLSLSETNKEVDSNSGYFYVTVSSNTSWKASNIPSWINLSSTSGSEDRTIILSYEANDETIKRSATIKFSLDKYNLSEEIKVTQSTNQLEDLEEEEL